MVALAPATVSPAPLASAAVAAFLARVRFRSATSTVVLFTVVVVPVTCRLPSMITVPPTPVELGSMVIMVLALIIRSAPSVRLPAITFPVLTLPVTVSKFAPFQVRLALVSAMLDPVVGK